MSMCPCHPDTLFSFFFFWFCDTLTTETDARSGNRELLKFSVT